MKRGCGFTAARRNVALPVTVARACGHQVAYLPVWRCGGSPTCTPGTAKTDHDAHVIADAAPTQPHTCAEWMPATTLWPSWTLCGIV